jgi:hypothetical protein
MNSRQRFLKTIQYGAPDRASLPGGHAQEVLQAWHAQGFPPADLADLFHYDEFDGSNRTLIPTPP